MLAVSMEDGDGFFELIHKAKFEYFSESNQNQSLQALIDGLHQKQRTVSQLASAS